MKDRDYSRIINIIDSLIMFLIFILISLIISFYFINSDNRNNNEKDFNSFESSKNINVYYDDLSESEVIIVKSWLKDMKKEYLMLIENLTFTKNQSIYNPERKDNYIGRNFNDESIYVLYTGNYDANKQTLCHEVLHVIISGLDEDKEEWFVDNIEEYGVCYEN